MLLTHFFKGSRYPSDLQYILNNMHADVIYLSEDNALTKELYATIRSRLNSIISKISYSELEDIRLDPNIITQQLNIKEEIQHLNQRDANFILLLVDKTTLIPLGGIKARIFGFDECQIGYLASLQEYLNQGSRDTVDFRRKYTGTTLLHVLTHFVSENFISCENFTLLSSETNFFYYAQFGFMMNLCSDDLIVEIDTLKRRTKQYLLDRLAHIISIQRWWRNVLP